MKSDYLQDLKWIKNELRNLLPKQKIDNLDKAIDHINDEISEELEALKAADAQDSEDEERYRKRHE